MGRMEVRGLVTGEFDIARQSQLFRCGQEAMLKRSTIECDLTGAGFDQRYRISTKIASESMRSMCVCTHAGIAA